jgi:hypothetical protein
MRHPNVTAARPPTSRKAAARDCLISIGFIAGLIVLCLVTVPFALNPITIFVQACVLYGIGAVAILELQPAAIALRARVADQRSAISGLRRELEALAEAPHPFESDPRPTHRRTKWTQSLANLRRLALGARS